uniref:Uncharacterized protein n=1 Tax=Plectus sambesii TaxID=2011161 RepID=A0A914VZG1_9BILA
MEQHPQQRKKSPTASFGRKMSHAISDRARRCSVAVAPQLRKLDGIECLMETSQLTIEIVNENDVILAAERFGMHNACEFAPISMRVVNHAGTVIMTARLNCDEFVVYDVSLEAKRLMAFALSDPNARTPMVLGSPVAKIKHPVTGMKLFIFVQLVDPSQPAVYHVYKTTNEKEKHPPILVIEERRSLMMRALAGFGCTFADETFSIKKDGQVIADVGPKLNYNSNTNIYSISFNQNAGQDERVIAFNFGLLQMLRGAYPQLLHIMEEQRIRKGASSWRRIPLYE